MDMLCINNPNTNIKTYIKYHQKAEKLQLHVHKDSNTVKQSYDAKGNSLCFPPALVKQPLNCCLNSFQTLLISKDN